MYNDNYLKHYGVLGMRWGHRKAKPIVTVTRNSAQETTTGKKEAAKEESSTSKRKLTDKQKKALIIGAAAVGTSLAVIGGMYVYKKHNKPSHIQTMSFGKILDLEKMSTEDTVLKAGTKMQRISSKKVEDYAGEGKRIYVSYLKKDNRVYTDEMPGYIKSWARKGMVEGDGTAYKYALKAKTEIKVPSERKLAEIYMRTTNSPHVDDGSYKRFMKRLVNTENPEIQKFFKDIADAGYNAIVDNNDAGTLAKKPLILLNPKDDIMVTGSHKIRKLERIMSVALM